MLGVWNIGPTPALQHRETGSGFSLQAVEDSQIGLMRFSQVVAIFLGMRTSFSMDEKPHFVCVAQPPFPFLYCW
ncbi:hypothetical protein LEMLEM_LOCUS15750, partial [Lemmus lemmus]